ncbi:MULTISPECIES: autotransporter domain-containing protein [unclassified Ruegeria]|uniref:autotransporter domain-containing protein n=1 Tax=unclassified Ruegeria TaxID=2625375 RepID=UPI001488857A|nr:MULTISPECIES: autotransporter domain-containing protein [unclassified Ruegeria]
MAKARLSGLILVCSIAASSAAAQSLDDGSGYDVRDNIKGALAILGISAAPNESASVLLLDKNVQNGDDYDLRGGQFGGGFRVSEDIPVYLEGYIGFTNYDPEFLLSGVSTSTSILSHWTSVAATGGIGWQFDINENWKIRPMINLSIGRVQSDSSIAAQVISSILDADLDFLSDGGITALGYGGSLVAEFNRRWANDYELDLRFRHTHIILEPLDTDLVGQAEAISTVAWSRVRVPTGVRVFSQPTRWVGEVSASYIPGDQGIVLDSEWLAQLGAGIELDLSKNDSAWVEELRLMARIAKGDNIEGYSVGVAIKF